MTDTPKDWKCNCPMECNTLSYSFSHVSRPLDPEEECPPEVYDSTHDFLMKPFYENPFPSKYVRRLMKIRNNISDEPMDYCKRNLRYRAEVTFKLATDTIPVTVISGRLSFFDKMSAFGKKEIHFTVLLDNTLHFLF